MQAKDNVIIEGDALNVIQSVSEAIPIADWRGRQSIHSCQTIYS